MAVADAELVVVVVVGVPVVAVYWYRSNLSGPPQISAELPAQAILHWVEPSGAGPPPLRRVLSQSGKDQYLLAEEFEEEGGSYSIGMINGKGCAYNTRGYTPRQRDYNPRLRRQLGTLLSL